MNKIFTVTALALFTAPAMADGWTDWLNRDGPSGNGDYENKSAYSLAQVCAQPARIEAMVVGGTTVYRPGDALPDRLSYFSPEQGLVCVNSQQPGGTCQDYTVRYYCVEREDLTEQFPVLKEVDRQNAVYAQTARSFKGMKRVNRARKALAGEDIAVSQSLFRLGQGYDRLNDQFRNECLDQTHPDFRVERVPVTTPTTTKVRFITTSKSVYEALAQSSALGVDLGFKIDDKDVKFGVGTTSSVLKSEYFQESRAVFAVTFEKVISQYLLNTQIRPIKQAIVDGTTSSPDNGPLLEPFSDTHKQAFYKECGDRFLDGVGMGAKLTVMLHYDTKKFSAERNATLETTVGAAIEELLTVGHDLERATQLEQVLASAGVEFDVVRWGGPTGPQTLTRLRELGPLLESFENGITEENAIAITNSFREYTLPAKYHSLNHYDVFADTRDQLLNAQLFASVINEVGARCQSLEDYNKIFVRDFAPGECGSENLKTYLKHGRSYCSVTSDWNRCVHPLHATTEGGASIIDLLERRVKDFDFQTERSSKFQKSVTGGVWNKKCIEDTATTCLPANCRANIMEGGRFGVGQGFRVEPWSYHSPANSDEQGFYSFVANNSSTGQSCVNSHVKACTKRIGGSTANYTFQVELEGVCAVERPFSID